MPSPSNAIPVSPEFQSAWATMNKYVDEVADVHGEDVATRLLRVLSEDRSTDLRQALNAALTTEAPEPLDDDEESLEEHTIRRPRSGSGFPGRVD